MSENKEFYVTIQGKKVFVSEEVYREDVRPIRAIQRQQRRAWKCRIVGRKGNLIRCPYKCDECPFAMAGNIPTGNVLSLDKFKELGVEIIDREFDLERMYLEQEERTSLQEQMHNAILQLTPRQREIVIMHFFENKRQEEICQILGLTKGTVSLNLKRAIRNLQEILQK